MTCCDVAVVGAGPAGATAALHLARGGLRVVLLERRAPPRSKTCGGGVVRRALQPLPPDVRAALLVEAVEAVCRRIAVGLLRRGTETVIEPRRPPIYLVMRASFDAALVRAAVRAGARLMVAAVERLGPGPAAGCVTLGTEAGEEVSARFVVGADGATGTCARLLGARPRRVPALECEVRVGGADWRRLGHTARFDFEVVHHGYVSPRDGCGVVQHRRCRTPDNCVRSPMLHRRFMGHDGHDEEPVTCRYTGADGQPRTRLTWGRCGQADRKAATAAAVCRAWRTQSGMPTPS